MGVVHGGAAFALNCFVLEYVRGLSVDAGIYVEQVAWRQAFNMSVDGAAIAAFQGGLVLSAN